MVMAVAMLGLAMTACGGDDKDEPGEGGSAKLTMSQLKGKWAVVTQDYNEQWYSLDYNSEDEEVYEIREFTSNNVCKQYENDRGFTLKGGYLYGCSMSDYELEETKRAVLELLKQLGKKATVSAIAENNNMSRKQIYRYIRLNELIGLLGHLIGRHIGDAER